MNPPLLLKHKMVEIVNKSLLDKVDLTRYVDPNLFDLGLLTHYFSRDDEELFAETAVQLLKVVAEAEIDEICTKLQSIRLDVHHLLLQRFRKVQCHSL